MARDELEARIRDLETRLRAVEDVQALHRLKARYAQLLDARFQRRGGLKPAAEVEALAHEAAGLFTEDAVWDGGPGLGVCEGRTAIARRLAHSTLSFAWHFFVKPEIEVDGDTASGSWDILSPCTTAEGRAMWMAGVEHDTYVREGGVWLHRSMKLDLVFMAPHDRGWARAKPDARG
ncbi:MAG: nuclear transport factor 2 family protein [Myxococcota bacterium]